MKIIVNGERHDIPDEATAAHAVRLLTSAPSGVALAINDEVVARGEWETTRLREGDRIEVLTAVQGG